MLQKAIAIDGPSGAGKSTIAKLVAEELGFRYIDTGAMYRACALKALRLSLDVNDEAAISAMVKGIEIRLGQKNGLPLIFLDGEDVTAAIRSAEVTRDVPIVCRYAEVREKMVEIQRGLAENGGGSVMDGRDIGTNVLPRAMLKIFLTADVQERGRRRYAEWKAKGIAAEWSQEEIVADLIRRDQLDSNREINPLRRAEDSILLDSTALTIEEIADRIIALWKEKMKDVL